LPFAEFPLLGSNIDSGDSADALWRLNDPARPDGNPGGTTMDSLLVFGTVVVSTGLGVSISLSTLWMIVHFGMRH
jgi:hypothetical protein